MIRMEVDGFNIDTLYDAAVVSDLHTLKEAIEIMAEVNLRLTEEHTEQMDMVIKLLSKPSIWRRLWARLKG